MSVGRNEPCPCGSGRKYKNCHYARDRAREISRWKESLSPPVGMAMEWLRDAFQSFTVKDVENGLELGMADATTTIRARPAPPDADVDLTDVITVETIHRTGVPFNEEVIARLNAFNALSAIVRDKESEDWVSLTRVSVFRGDERAFLDAHIPLLGASVMLQNETIPRLFAFAAGREIDDPIAGADEACPVTPADLQEVIAGLDPRTRPSLSENGLSFELPWIAASDAQDDREVASMVSVGPLRHPVWGNGLVAELRLPLEGTAEQLAVVCEEFNRHEFENADGPPLLGAWGIAGEEPHLATFTIFLPNLFYRDSHLQMIIAWMTRRNDVVRRLVKMS